MSPDADLSRWGWGLAEREPTEDQRREAKRRVETRLGFPERPLLTMPEDDPALPDPRVDPPFHFCTTDPEARARHAYGKSYPDLVRGFYGEYDTAPDAVARPEEASEIPDLLLWASEETVAIVPFGGGTSVVGGVECHGPSYTGVVSLDTRELDQVLDVDHTSRAARVQAGATGPELNAQLAEDGLQLRHYPQSYEFSTFGGWVATRAGGHFATRYTHIDDFVESVRAETPIGPLETRRLPASGAGPDPNRFLLGSEGAFGVITEGWVRVQPRPEHRSRATVRFAEFWDGVEATREIVQARHAPANCRLLDPAEAMLNELADDGSSILLLGFESLDGPTDEQMDRALAICADHGGEWDAPTHEGPTDERPTDDTDAGREPEGGDESEERSESEESDETDRSGTEGEWRRSFFDAPYRFNTLVSIGVLVDTFETAVTWDRFPALHEAVRENVGEAMREECGAGFLSCRFTHVYPDGPAPYYTLLAPADPGREIAQWREIKRVASDTLDAFGATSTHHHAVGRVHREHYHREIPDGYLDALRSMKRTLDPDGIMNPGALL